MQPECTNSFMFPVKRFCNDLPTFRFPLGTLPSGMQNDILFLQWDFFLSPVVSDIKFWPTSHWGSKGWETSRGPNELKAVSWKWLFVIRGAECTSEFVVMVLIVGRGRALKLKKDFAQCKITKAKMFSVKWSGMLVVSKGPVHKRAV